MIIEGTKDYGTGIITMISEGETPSNEVWGWLERNYGIDRTYDDVITRTLPNTFRGMLNPEKWEYFPPKPLPAISITESSKMHAFARGKAAFCMDKLLNQNPYNTNTVLGGEWRRGWYYAKSFTAKDNQND